MQMNLTMPLALEALQFPEKSKVNEKQRQIYK
jgi:hypothetical protein